MISTMWDDFNRICDCGGRLSGTPGEQAATALLAELGADATGVRCQPSMVPYAGWRALHCELLGPVGEPLDCHPLVRTPATAPEGLEAEVLDLGRGTPEEFAAHRQEIPGRIVLVRHELMFAAGTIHRRLKYQWATEAGAAGFLIAGPLKDAAVAGSSGRGDAPGIPALGISRRAAASLARTSSGRPRARIIVTTEEGDSEAANLLFEVPGQTEEFVLLSAHIDGHDIGESAIDNASGLAVALEVARRLSPHTSQCRRGLRLAFFNVEEWALTGSALYADSLSELERSGLALNVNLDSVGVGGRLTALTSDFPELEPFLLLCAESVGQSLGLFRPAQMNSDHGNFARIGVPAFRLVAGFNDPLASSRLVLTAEDRRDKVLPESLGDAADLVEEIVQQAQNAGPEVAASWRRRSD